MKKKYVILVLILLIFAGVTSAAETVDNSAVSSDSHSVTQKKVNWFWKKNKKPAKTKFKHVQIPEEEYIAKKQAVSLNEPLYPQADGSIVGLVRKEVLALPSANNKDKEEVQVANKVKIQQKEEKKTSNIDNEATDIDISSDLMEYKPDNYELTATGNVVVTMLKDGSKLFADKMVYNTDLNTIKGYGNVKMVKGNSTVYGDFVNINLNEENILVDKPSTQGQIFKVEAKEGYIYPEQIITQTGKISVAESANMVLASPAMGGVYYLPSASESLEKRKFYEKESTSPSEKKTQLRAKVIHIKSMQDHDEVVVDGASYYYNNKKMFSVPRMELTTNKAQDFVETNLPEIGSFKNYGTYFGPGFVFNVPGGSTLKLAPVLQLGRHSSAHDIGVGVLGRFHSKSNITEAMWGTVDSMFVLRGQQQLAKNTKLQYAHDAYMDEWFMGMRMPQYLLQLVDDRTVELEDIDAIFRNKFTAGYVSDYYRNHLGTMRLRWQTELSKTFLSKWNEDESVGFNAGLTSQTSASMYGTGDFQGVLRVGPFVSTRLKNWEQTISYYQGAQAGQSPMLFDQYMYGKANLMLRETLALNKYIRVGYLGSYALLKDNWENKAVQENQFFVALGPEDFKVALGYDPVRSRLHFDYLMTLKGDEMEIPYDKMIIDDANTLGKKNKKKKNKDEEEL